ncbi:hypothetical protein FRB94_008400 [Tulasnella sp. JGI-2019a]|nr:hypothetical protein FRB93_001654 [Tulasnella sp. JGI-2019a]KAG8996310.1 hypothetical protein FRB94_008400 [Tulasnella sp. JGI-2019a]KAG9035565.1 hypothetical protein FRB95_011107 [Tulasnella sp. JGI-2019a]
MPTLPYLARQEKVSGGPHRVLFLSEVLLEVFDKLSAKGLVTTALVVKHVLTLLWTLGGRQSTWTVCWKGLLPSSPRVFPVNQGRKPILLVLKYKDVTRERWTTFLDKYASNVTYIKSISRWVYQR